MSKAKKQTTPKATTSRANPMRVLADAIEAWMKCDLWPGRSAAALRKAIGPRQGHTDGRFDWTGAVDFDNPRTWSPGCLQAAMEHAPGSALLLKVRIDNLLAGTEKLDAAADLGEKDARTYELTGEAAELVQWLWNLARELGGMAAASISKQPAVDDDATLSPRQIAEQFNVPLEALKKRLGRRRKKDFGCFIEVADRGSKEPQFLYRVGDIRDTISALQASRDGRHKDDNH